MNRATMQGLTFIHILGVQGASPPCGAWGVPQYRLDKENHREKYSKKQSNSRKKQSCGSSNPANMDVFFEPFLLQFLLSKRYWGVPTFPFPLKRTEQGS